jgi:hypothetical protein
LVVRSKKPQAVNVKVARGLDNDVIFEVVGQDRGEENCIVTVYSADLFYAVSGDTDAMGKASISLDGCPKCPLFYTVVGPDIVPVVDEPLQ